MAGNTGNALDIKNTTRRTFLPLGNGLRCEATDLARQFCGAASQMNRAFDCFLHDRSESITFTPMQPSLSVKEGLSSGMSASMAKRERTFENIELGKRIRRVREEFAGAIDQGRFAAPLGVTRQSVVHWENGRGASRKNLLKIAQEYDVSFEWLASDVGEPRGSTSRPSITKVKSAPIITEHKKLTARLGELFAAVLKADENIQRDAIQVLEALTPTSQRSRQIKTKEKS